MANCQNLYVLSTIACKLSECMTAEELAALSADLVVLGDMLANILAQDVLCKSNYNTSRTDFDLK